MRVVVALALLLAAVPLISADYDAPVTQINLDLPPVQASGLRAPCTFSALLSDARCDFLAAASRSRPRLLLVVFVCITQRWQAAVENVLSTHVRLLDVCAWVHCLRVVQARPLLRAGLR